MAVVSHLGLLFVYLDHLRIVFHGLHHYAKFGLNRYRSSNNMQVLIFCKLDLKMPIHITKWVFWTVDHFKWRMCNIINIIFKWHPPLARHVAYC